MFRPFQSTDVLFYVGMVFMIFPLGGVVWFDYPLWTLGPSIAFGLSYLAIIHVRDAYRTVIAGLWFYLLAYIVFMTLAIESSMMWFFFFITNLLLHRFQDDFKTYRFISALAAVLLAVAGTLFSAGSLVGKVIVGAVVLFMMAIYYIQRKIFIEERMRVEIYQKNETINLLAAENERNRIGRDLHDTLGHTFAMLSVKTELALKQLDKENLAAVRKELTEISQISKTSMKEVRELINNLKSRTVAEELATIQEMFQLSGIDLAVDNQLQSDQLSPVIQSSLVMILRELATNIIKHAEASRCQIQLNRTDRFTISVIDDGVGFKQLTGEELHSIRERLQRVKGQVEIVSQAQPTHIRVVLEEMAMA